MGCELPNEPTLNNHSGLRTDAGMSAHQGGGFGRPGSVVHAAAEHHRIVAINV
jgi:hypothetical protein